MTSSKVLSPSDTRRPPYQKASAYVANSENWPKAKPMPAVCERRLASAVGAFSLVAYRPDTWPSMPKAAMVLMLTKASEAVWLAWAKVSSSCGP